MTAQTPVQILSAASDGALAERLRAALRRGGVSAALAEDARASEEDGLFLILCTEDAAEDLEFSRILSALAKPARRARLRLARVSSAAEPEGAIPPILTAERGEDGFLRPVNPPDALGVIGPEGEIPDDLVARAAAWAGVDPARAGPVRAADRSFAAAWPRLAAIAAAVAVIGWAGTGAWLGQALKTAQSEAREADAFATALMTGMTERLPDAARQTALLSVAEDAMAALGGENLDRLDDAALARRAELWRLVAETEDVAGDPAAAREAFALAYRTTEKLLERQPADPDRRFDHAQSAFWLANSAFRRGDLASADAGFTEYASLISGLTESAPDNALYQAEAAHADVNLGLVALEKGRPEQALTRFEAAIDAFRSGPVEAGAASAEDVANAHAWRADALTALGRAQDALDARRTETEIHRAELAGRPDDAFVQRRLANSLRAQASLLAEAGNVERANAALEEALDGLEALMDARPDNARFRRLYMQALHERARLALWAGETVRAKLLADQARRVLAGKDPQGADDDRHVTRAELQLISAQIAQASGALEAARADIASAAGSADLAVESGRASARPLAAEAYFIQGEILASMGQRDEAMRAYREAARRLDGAEAVSSRAGQDLLARIRWRLGERDSARALKNALIESDYQRPDFLAFWERESQPATAGRASNRERDDGEL